MLFRRIRRTTGSTGVTLTVTHGLLTPPDYWSIAGLSDRNLGRAYVRPLTVLTNTIAVVNSAQTTVTLDVFVMSFRGELY